MKEMKNPSEKKGHRQKAATQCAGALRQIKINSTKLLLHSGDVSQPDYKQYCYQLYILHRKYLRQKINAY